MSITNLALEQIKASGLNQFRCNLTGAPYATLDDYEIMIALRAMWELDSTVTVERLVDQWQLRAITFNSQSLPSLRGASQKGLLSNIATGPTGQVKVLTYLMTRLFYPHLGAEPMPSETQRDRMLFAVDLFDSALNWEPMKVSELVQNLTVVDAYLAMPHWHSIWLFESTFSKVGLKAAPAAIKECFADPSVMIGEPKRVESAIKFMFELMLHCAERDGANGKSGNRLAQEIMFIQAQAMPKVVIPHFQKQLSEADLQRLEKKRMLDNNKPLRIAHSAIHGKNYKAGFTGTAEIAARMAEMKKNTAAKKAATESKPKKSNVDPKLAAAFAKLILPKI